MRALAALAVWLAGAASPSGAQVLWSREIRGTDLDVDLHGRIYVLNAEERTLTLFGEDGEVLLSAGGPGWDGGLLDEPAGVWARNGMDIFVADRGNHRVHRFDRTLSHVSSLYTREDPDPEKRFGYPSDLAVSRSGDLFLCDGENSRVLQVAGGDRIRRSFGGFDAGRGRLRRPSRIEAGPADRLYVLDETRVVVYDAFGNYLREIPLGEDVRAVLWADSDGLVLVEGDSLRSFDAEDRPGDLLPLPPGLGTVCAVAFRGPRAYYLTDRALVVAGGGIRGRPDAQPRNRRDF
ncbi:MAG: NHL repeat-containing protein [Bacteroidota bacterium]